MFALPPMWEGEAANRPGVTRNQERLLTMLAFIQTHYDEKLTLEDIAAAASVSKRECLRSFRAGIHRTPMEYLTDYRIDMAKKLLRTTDLPITQIALQTGPQIRLVQDSDTVMAEKIQSTIVNTIPLWKSQMVLALGVAHSEDAIRAQREVTDMTNSLLRKNAERLKMSTIETARETERGVVDMETLRATNQSLITTLDEVVKIQEEGKQKRRLAEEELGKIEGELKQKLLDIRG